MTQLATSKALRSFEHRYAGIPKAGVEAGPIRLDSTRRC